MKHPSLMTRAELMEAGEKELVELDTAFETLKTFSRLITADASTEDAPNVMAWVKDRMPDQINNDIQALLSLSRIASHMAEGIMKCMAVITVDEPDMMIKVLAAMARRNNGRKS